MDLSYGPEERNVKLLGEAIDTVVKKGADWIITPETALQGYYFAMDREYDVQVQPGSSVKALCDKARNHGVTIFLGCAERSADDGKCYNSCLVIGPDGEIIGRHWKMHSHGGASEAWASLGDSVDYVECGEMKAGILICADSWFMEHSRELKEKKADVIMIPALWPPAGECGPGDCWERCSRESGLPVWVCNQTGNGILDLSKAESAVIVDGERKFSYRGIDQAALVFDWDPVKRKTESTDFDVIPV